MSAPVVDIEPATDPMAEYVRRIVDQAPPLSDERRRRISALLAPAPLPEPTKKASA